MSNLMHLEVIPSNLRKKAPGAVSYASTCTHVPYGEERPAMVRVILNATAGIVSAEVETRKWHPIDPSMALFGLGSMGSMTAVSAGHCRLISEAEFKARNLSPIGDDGDVDDLTHYDLDFQPARKALPASLQRKLGLVK